MGVQSDSFQQDEVQLAAWAKALAHPARLAILQTLAEHETCICGEIVDVLPLAQSTVSQHLKTLKEADLVQGMVDGPRSCYCLDRAVLRRAQAAFGALFEALDLGPSDAEACC